MHKSSGLKTNFYSEENKEGVQEEWPQKNSRRKQTGVNPPGMTLSKLRLMFPTKKWEATNRKVPLFPE